MQPKLSLFDLGFVRCCHLGDDMPRRLSIMTLYGGLETFGYITAGSLCIVCTCLWIQWGHMWSALYGACLAGINKLNRASLLSTIDEAMKRYNSPCTYWESYSLFLFKSYIQWQPPVGRWWTKKLYRRFALHCHIRSVLTQDLLVLPSGGWHTILDIYK